MQGMQQQEPRFTQEVSSSTMLLESKQHLFEDNTYTPLAMEEIDTNVHVYHGITEWLELEVSSGHHLVQLRQP